MSIETLVALLAGEVKLDAAGGAGVTTTVTGAEADLVNLEGNGENTATIE